MSTDQRCFCCRIPALIAVSALCACTGSSTDGSAGPSGTSGGVSASGGSLGDTGGATQSGGTNSTVTTSSTGGSAPTGGMTTGGSAPTGGVTSTGGASASGGAVTNGGAQTTGGSAPTGGRTSAGGAKATGGAPATGGATAAGGSTGTAGAANSSGCGLANYPAACTTSGSPCSVDVSGTARTYFIYLPSGYDAAQAYPLVFQFHPMGGTAQQAINMPSIRSSFPAIYVTPQGLTSNGSTGWANTNGQDIAFTKAMLNYVQTNYCVDTKRIFSTGFSYGGMMSFAVGCEMSNVFRAIAPMSGALYSDFNCKGTGPAIAMWGSHGLSDTTVPIADGRSGRDKILQENHCGTETVATTPSPCVSYQGCDSGYPSTWCEFDGGHTIPSFASSAIAAFFKQF